MHRNNCQILCSPTKMFRLALPVPTRTCNLLRRLEYMTSFQLADEEINDFLSTIKVSNLRKND